MSKNTKNKGEMMQSRLHDTMKLAVTALLTAIDETMNSNTMLLKVQAEKPLTTSNYQDELRTFLHSPLFIEMVLEIDQQRLSHHQYGFNPILER